MKLWMDVICDLEHVMNDHERIFDAWTAGVWMAWSPAFSFSTRLSCGLAPNRVRWRDLRPSPTTRTRASTPGRRRRSAAHRALARHWPFHDCAPMSASDLKLLFQAADEGGLNRFLYHHQANLSAGEWVVISDMCGTQWNPRASDFQPPDMPVLCESTLSSVGGRRC